MQGEPIRLKPAPALLVAALLVHLAGAVAIFLMKLPPVATVLLVLLVIVSAVQTQRAQAEKRGLLLVPAIDGAIRICWDYGRDSWGTVLPGAVLFPGLSWLSVRSADGHVHRLMLIPSEMENAQWRQLRTWLRHLSVGQEHQ